MVKTKIILGVAVAGAAAAIMYQLWPRPVARRPQPSAPVYRQVTNEGQPTGINAVPVDIRNWDAWI